MTVFPKLLLGVEPGIEDMMAASCEEADAAGLMCAAQMSIAISLKRIADALCGTKESIGIHECIFNISERRQA